MLFASITTPAIYEVFFNLERNQTTGRRYTIIYRYPYINYNINIDNISYVYIISYMMYYIISSMIILYISNNILEHVRVYLFN